MTIRTASTTRPSVDDGHAGTGATVVAVLVAVACLGFAAANVAFEVTGRFADGPYAEYASGLTVMNWLVVVLKLAGAAVAVLSVVGPRSGRPAVLGALVWAAFGTLGVYAAGNVVQAAGLALGATGSPDQIDLAGVGYVLFFLLLATGFGILAVSYSRRQGLRRPVALAGVVGAPLVLGSLLVGFPALLAALGVMPAI